MLIRLYWYDNNYVSAIKTVRIKTLIARNCFLNILNYFFFRHYEWANAPEIWARYGYLNRNFSLSCKNITLEKNILTADCRDKSGQYRTSSIDLDLVLRNTDGVLTPGYNFSHSSDDIMLDLKDLANPKLCARSRSCYGSLMRSWVKLNAVVGNQDGKLAVTDGFIVKTYLARNFPHGFWLGNFQEEAFKKKYQDYDY